VGARTTDENLFLGLISLTKMGKVLSYYLDVDQDGAVAAGVNPCLNARGARPAAPVNGDFWDTDLREFGSGLTLFVESINAVSSEVDLGSDFLNDVNSACALLPAMYNFCGITDPATFTANQVKGFQSIMKEDQDVGIGSDCAGNIGACNCP
jgi:hypothetical protein